MTKFDEAFQTTEIDDPIQHVRDAVHINGADLRTELERLPADLAHYGFEFAAAQRAAIAAKISLDEVRAAIYLLVRETLDDDSAMVAKKSSRGPTEATIDAHLTQHPRVVEAKAALVEAEFKVAQIRAVCDALRAKRENLTSLVLLARAEMAGTHGFRAPASEEETPP